MPTLEIVQRACQHACVLRVSGRDATGKFGEVQKVLNDLSIDAHCCAATWIVAASGGHINTRYSSVRLLSSNVESGSETWARNKCAPSPALMEINCKCCGHRQHGSSAINRAAS